MNNNPEVAQKHEIGVQTVRRWRKDEANLRNPDSSKFLDPRKLKVFLLSLILISSISNSNISGFK